MSGEDTPLNSAHLHTRVRGRRRISVVAAAIIAGTTAAAGAVTSAPPAVASSSVWCGNGGTPAVVALQDTHFYVDTSSTAQLLSSYAGYRVEAGASARRHLYLGWSDFTGGVITLAVDQPSSVALPPMLTGGSSTQYALLTAASTTVVPQTHTVTVYDGPPAAGGTALCSRTFTFTDVADTIKALANKVSSVIASPPSVPAVIGDTVTVTVEGNTGTLGAGPVNDPGVLGYTPNALSDFPVSAWRLERTELTVSPDGVAPARTFTDRLFLSGASGPARPYTAKYTFRAVGPSPSPAQLKPIQYIASGTQVKHTDIGGTSLYALPAVSSAGAVTVAKKLLSPESGVLPEGGGTASYSVTLSNSSPRTAQVDDVTDTLPADATFVAGSLTVDGASGPDPLVSGRSVLVPGPLAVPAGGTSVLRYSVQLGSTSGVRTNSAVAHLGLVSYDTTTDVTTTAPATADVSVLGSAGATLQSDSAATAAGTPVTVDVLANDSTPSGLPMHVTSLSAPSQGSASLVATGEVVYTPTLGASGMQTFTYTAADGYVSGTGSVTVTVSPLAARDTYSTGKNSTLTAAVSVLANDACTSCTVSTTLVQPPTIGTSPAGTVTMSSDGTFTFAPPSNVTGIVTFRYRATDPSTGLTSDGDVTINLADLAPDLATTSNGTAVTIDVQANDPGCTVGCRPQAGSAPSQGVVSYSGSTATYTPTGTSWGLDRFTYGVTGNTGSATTPVTVLVAPPITALRTTYGTTATAPAPGGGGCSGCTFAVGAAAGHGSVTVDATTGRATYQPEAGFAGTDTFTYLVQDPTSGLVVAGTTTVTVGPDAVDDTAEVLLGGSTSGDVSENDACPTTCTRTLLTSPGDGVLTFRPDGTWTYQAGTTITPVTFTYRVASSVSGAVTDDATVRIAVRGAVDDSTTTPAGTSVVVPVRDNDPCSSCTLSAVGEPSSGAVAVDGSGVRFTPLAGMSGRATFTYTLSGSGTSTTATVTVVMLPKAISDTLTVVSGGSAQLLPTSNDICSFCTLTSVGSPGSGTATLSGDVVTFTAMGVGSGSTTFTYTAVDDELHSVTGTVDVTIVPAPAVTDDVASVLAQSTTALDVTSNDGCTTCELAVASDPQHGTVSVAVDGRMFYTSTPGWSGRDSFTYVATDPTTGATAAADVQLVVRPLAVDDRAQTGVGQDIVVDVLNNDACTNCTLTLGDVGGPATVEVASGGLLIRPLPDSPGTLTAAYTATDPVTGESATATLTLVISNARPDAASTAASTPVTLDVLSNDTCAGCLVSGVASTSPAGAGTTDYAGTTVTVTPSEGFAGVITATYTAAADGGVPSVQSTLRVLVAPAAHTLAVAPSHNVTTSVLGVGACAGCTVRVLTAPYGDLAMDRPGEFTYTALDKIGSDGWTYELSDPISLLSVESAVTVDVVDPGSPALTVTSTASEPAAVPAAGDALTFTWTVKNTGDVPLADLVLDTTAGSAMCPAESLDPGQSTSCSSTRTLTQADVDAGQVTDTGTVTGAGPTESISDHSTLTVALTRAPELSVITTSSVAASPSSSGDPVTLTAVVTSTGNTTVSALTAALDAGHALSCAQTTLAPGASTTCVGAVALTTGDIEAATWTGTVVATAAAPGASEPISAFGSTSLGIVGEPTATPTTPATTTGPTGEPTPAASSTTSPTPSPTSGTSAAAPGETSFGTVSGVVWFDRNQDGDRNAGEWLLPGAQVVLTATAPSRALAASPRRFAALAVREGDLRRVATSDSRGAYAFSGVPAGSYRVTASVVADGFSYTSDTDGRSDWVVAVDVSAGGTATASFAGLGHGTLDATVVAATTGKPIDHADVSCVWAGFDDTPGTKDDVHLAAVAGTDGSITLEHVPYGAYSCSGQDPTTHATSSSVQTLVVSAAAVQMRLPILGGPSGTLARTGTNAGTMLLFSLGCLIVGLGLVVCTRQRRIPGRHGD
jgi:uncharacterized repeat protein (TIGR01451 family)